MFVAIFAKLLSLSKKQALTVGAIGLLTLVLGGGYLTSLVSSRGEAVVKLSNGKQVVLGESRASLMSDLGVQLRADDGAHYSYLSADGVVEATMVVMGGRLVAVKVSQNGANVQPTTGAGIGKEIPLVRTKIGAALRPLPSGPFFTSLYGYSWATPGTTSFYFTDPCRDDGVLAGWAVAEKGSEALAVGQVKRLACNGFGG